MQVSDRLKKWDVWLFDQEAARANTDPQQPLDPSKPHRPYLVISDNAVLANATKNTKVICIPLGGKSQSRLFDVPLATGQAGCTKDCYIWCSEIYTVKVKYFCKRLGNAGFVSDKVEQSLRKILNLR